MSKKHRLAFYNRKAAEIDQAVTGEPYAKCLRRAKKARIVEDLAKRLADQGLTLKAAGA